MSTTKTKSITFSQETGRWEVMVPINWSKIMSPTYELAGSYATEKEALDALDNYYDKTASQMRYGGVMARVEADQQTIVSLAFTRCGFEKRARRVENPREVCARWIRLSSGGSTVGGQCTKTKRLTRFIYFPSIF